MAALTEQETFYDINPINPTVITEPFVIVCTDTDAMYQIGDPDGKNRRGFIVSQDADIVVVNSSGGTLVRGVGFFTTQRTADVLYSKTYTKSIYSGIKFAALGTYTVTKHIQCGTYPKAAFFNWAILQIKIIFETIAALALRVTATENKNVEQDTTLSNHSITLQSHTSELADHETRVTLLESNPTIIVVADHATMLALTGLKTGSTVYVISDTNGKRAEYLYDGTTFQKTSDPDWENINIDWSALLNIPAGVAALIAGTLKSTTLADMPTPSDSNDAQVLSWDKTAGKYKLVSVDAAAGVGDVSFSGSSATVGHIPIIDTTTGKSIVDSGIDPLTGWIPADETWTYASADSPTFTMTIPGDKTGKYSKGMKIRLTQDSVIKHFIITADPVYSSPNTTITMYGGTDYTLTNTAITNPFFSLVQQPYGFNRNPDKWSIIYSETANVYVSGSLSYVSLISNIIRIPIGTWDVSLDAGYGGADTGDYVYLALSSSLTSASHPNLISFYGGFTNNGAASVRQHISGTVVCTTATYFHIIMKSVYHTVIKLSFGDGRAKSVIRCKCAWL